MKINEHTIYIFLLGILAGIICMRCMNYFRESTKKVPQKEYIDNFEYEKECLVILKRLELRNEHFKCLDKTAFWGTDSLSTFQIVNYAMRKSCSFAFQRKHVLLVSTLLSICYIASLLMMK